MCVTMTVKPMRYSKPPIPTSSSKNNLTPSASQKNLLKKSKTITAWEENHSPTTIAYRHQKSIQAYKAVPI